MERHYEHDEYEDNDLRHFVHNFKNFWDRHGNKVLGVVVVGSLSFAGWSWYTRNQAETRQNALMEFDNASSPTSLKAAADNHIKDMPGMAANTYLRSGDLALAEAIDVNATQEDRDKAQALAKDAYTAAKDATDQPVYQANALLGLAAVAENAMAFDEAKGHYEAVLALAESAHLGVHAAKAKTRLALLPELQQPVTLLPDPEPTPGATDTGLGEGLDSGLNLGLPSDNPLDGLNIDPSQFQLEGLGDGAAPTPEIATPETATPETTTPESTPDAADAE